MKQINKKQNNVDPEWDAEEQELWYSSMVADKSHHFDSERAYLLFLNRTRLSVPTEPQHVPFLKRLYFPIASAAAVVALLIASYIAYCVGSDMIIRRMGDIVVEAPYGAKTELCLPDSTRVWLNAGSRLVYSQSFGIKERSLSLEGEAYFEVHKRVDMPFDVRTKELGVQVLGTKFNFRNYEDDMAASVNLMEGKVALDNLMDAKQTLTYLKPLEKAVLNKQTGRLEVSRSRVRDAIEWTHDNLFFDELPLEDIVRELNRSYDVRIRIADESLKHVHFYATFNRKEQSISKVLGILTATHQIYYTEEGDEILLYKNTGKKK